MSEIVLQVTQSTKSTKTLKIKNTTNSTSVSCNHLCVVLKGLIFKIIVLPIQSIKLVLQNINFYKIIQFQSQKSDIYLLKDLNLGYEQIDALKHAF